MNDKTKKEIKFLKVYSGFLMIALLTTIFYVMNHNKENNFEEINVKQYH